MHFGLKTYQIPRKCPDSVRSGGFAKFYGIVDLRQTKPSIADSDYFYHGRFLFDVKGGVQTQKLGR